MKSTKRSKFTPKTPLDRALKYLSFRPRSEKEVRDYLKGDPETESVISKLKAIKFIDDQQFADWFLENRSRFNPKSKHVLSFELKQKGIGKNIISSQSENLDNKELAEQALLKKMRLWSKLPYLEFKAKGTRFLAARGFSWETIEATLKKQYNREDVS